MISFLHLLLALPLLLLFLFKKIRTIKNPAPRPPGPKGLPIIGNLHQLDNSNLPFQLLNLSKIYGPLFSLQLGFKPAIVVSSPKMAKQILKDHDLDVCRRPPLYSNQKLSYNGTELIFSPYSDYWKEIRKICVVHFFSNKRISCFYHVRQFEVKEMIKKISGHVRSSKITNLSEVILSCSSAIICSTAFGKRYEEEGGERSRFHGMINESQALLATVFLSDYIPFLGWIDKLTGLFARLENIYRKMNTFFQEVIDEHQDPKREKPKEDDIVDVLVQLKNQGRFSMDLTDDHIKGIIMDIILAAIETSAVTSIWAMTGLMKNPRVMKKVQEEIRTLCVKKEFIEENDIEKLVYLKAVIKETLRFFPSVPVLPRYAHKGFIIDGYEVKPNTLVYVNAWAIHRDPEAWKDPDEFYPERFLNSDVDIRGQDFELIPFGAGRRVCPGLPMGLANVELIVANLLNSFDWEMPAGMKREDIDTEGLLGLTRPKKNHLCLVANNPI